MVGGSVTLSNVSISDMIMVLGQANKVGLTLGDGRVVGPNFSNVVLSWTDAASLNALSQLLHNLSLSP